MFQLWDHHFSSFLLSRFFGLSQFSFERSMNSGMNLGRAMDDEAEESPPAAAARASRSPQESSDEDSSSSGCMPRRGRSRTARMLASPEAHPGSPALPWKPPTCPEGITASPTEVPIDQLIRTVNSTWTDPQGRMWWKHIDETHRYTIGSVTFVYRQPKKIPVGEPTVIKGQDGHTYQFAMYTDSDLYGFPPSYRITMKHYPFMLNDGETKFSSTQAARKRPSSESSEDHDSGESDEQSGEEAGEAEERKPAARKVQGKSLRRWKGKTPRMKRAFSETKSARRSDPRTGTYRKKFRRKAGTNAIRRVRQYQGKGVMYEIESGGTDYSDFRWTVDATRLLIPKTVFQLLVREIANDLKSDLRFTVDAMQALQAGAESHLVDVFQDANMCAIHAKRETLLYKDMRIATKIRRDCVPDGKFCEKRDWNGCFFREARGERAPSLYRTDGVAQGRCFER